MLQNSWECKNVNLRSADGAGSGLPKTARSHSVCLSSPLQKLVLFCALASNELQYVSKSVLAQKMLYLLTKFMHVFTQQFVQLGYLMYGNSTF
jgi:hypothetical protein